jgi:hypothetical protein
MSESIYHDKDGGTPPGGQPPTDLDEDIARAAKTLEEEKGRDEEQAYGHLESDFAGPGGNPRQHGPGRNQPGTDGKA